MNYTREPIIESVVTPREGCKLVLRNSKKSPEQEDFLVDAVEIVSFASAIFYRSTERPKPFLLPVSDYELIEVKETKMVLKAVSPERAIKIAGGKVKPTPKETVPKETVLKETVSKEEVSDKKSTKRRSRRKRQETALEEQKEQPKELKKGGDKNDETKVSSSPVRGLLPPPTTLIKDNLERLKNEELSKKPVEENLNKAVEESKESTTLPNPQVSAPEASQTPANTENSDGVEKNDS